jgi:NADH-quinone oxidoreductase subunit G
MPKLTIDGREIEVEAGTTVLQAALSIGCEIPHYCYHPGLSVSGNCRMCLVEVEKAPKLVISCATPVADGMVVHTRSEKVKQAQASVMEFLLINHPLDCSICDQAGECRLQEYAVAYGKGTSRYEDAKNLARKAVDIGEHVLLDQERCIQCSRCIRFCNEVSKTGELDFFQRGQRTMIGIYPGRRLDNPYSGNVVDICPVGALTLKEFRFQTRVWFLKNTPSVCAGCARGCNVLVGVGKQQELWTSRGQFDDRIKRIVPRVNDDVNGHWMCDEGRLSYQRQLVGERLASAQAPAGTDRDWDVTVRDVAEHLKTAASAGRAAAIFSPRLVSETYFAWRELFAGLGQVRVGVHRLHRGDDDALLVRADKGANARGAAWVLGESAEAGEILDQAAGGRFDTLLVFGDPLDPEDTAPVGEELRAKLAQLIYVGSFLDETARQASLLLPAAAWAEEDGSLVNFEGRVQWTRRCHLPRGEGRPGWRVAADVAEKAGVELPGWTSAADVLEALAASVEPFRGLTESRLGLLGVNVRPGAAATARG